MKILLINYHFFIHGGPDRYFFNIKEMLEARGHTVIPFAFDYLETKQTSYREFFPKPISGRGTFLLENVNLNTKDKINYVVKMFWNKEVEERFISILHTELPDIVYSIYLSSSMLPKIFKIAKSTFKIPVLYRLSDFHMFCPSYLFFRDGYVCKECINNPLAAVKYKCVRHSSAASLLRVLQIALIKMKGWYNSVDRFICPSRLMRDHLLEAGFPPEKVILLPTFAKDLQAEKVEKGHSILYFGKLVPEKGVEVLIKAYNAIDKPKYLLRLVGHCLDEYREYLISLVDAHHKELVIINPPLQGDDMWQVLRNCAFVVQPAIWLENMPNTLIEALSAGKPIIASEIGSLTELVTDGVNGYLVPPGDVGLLSSAISKMSTEADLVTMGLSSRRRFLENHTSSVHLEKLLEEFERLTGAPPVI